MPTFYNHQKRKHSGMTLVELIVALALGVVLVGGITRVYLENKRNYVQDEEIARLQENGRFLLNLLKREFKMAGFLGGIDPAALDFGGAITTDCSPGWALDVVYTMDFINDVGVTGNIASSLAGDTFATCVTAANVKAGTDLVTIKRTAGMATIQNAVYASGGTATNEEKKKSYYINITPNVDPVFEYVDTGFSATTLAAANKVGMWLYMAKVFYVRNYSVAVGDGIPTLIMISLQDKAMVETPLIEGVEDFHIEFGVPSATSEGTPVRFYANPTAGQLSSATVARIYVLMRTRNPIRGYTDTKTYTLGSKAPFTPGGSFMRRVFTTTIKIRN